MSKSELGVIDTLSAGLNTVLQAWWVLVIPVALDVLYWLGPKLSILPLVDKAVANLPSASGLGTEEQSLVVLRQSLEQIGQTLNLLSLLSAQLLGMPSLLVPESAADTAALRPAPAVEIRNLSAFVLLSIGLTLLGLLVGCFYLALIARRVRGEDDLRLDSSLWRRVWVYWGRVMLLALLATVALMVVNLPIMVMVLLIMYFSQFLAALLAAMWSIGMFWVVIFLFFTVDAIVINDVGPVRAAWNSFNVVRRNFWPAIGLIMLINVLTAGFSIVWQRLAINVVGALFSILGNAFIGTGLVAAALIFYRDRYLKWQEVLQHGGDDRRTVSREA